MVDTARLSLLSPPAPQLPSFQSLLIEGDYPTSSPLHLCLSHLSSSPRDSKSRPILITTNNKSRLTKGLVDLNDGWLAGNAGRGMTADLLSRIQIFYPGTPDHWVLLFSLLRTDAPVGPGSISTNLGQPVSLVVLHEPSAYFLDNDPPKSFTVSSYTRLITSALASLRSLNADTGPPPLAVFDSRLKELALPVLAVAITDPVIDGEEEAAVDLGPGRRPTKVESAVERYFDLIGRVEVVSQPSQALDTMRYNMILSSSQYSNFSLPSPLIWCWRKVQVETDGSQRTGFHWEM